MLKEVVVSKENAVAYDHFCDLLMASREKYEATELDIRDFILSKRKEPWNIGYVGSTLKDSYGANLPALFGNLIPVDDKRIGSADRYIILGTVYRDAEKSHKGAIRALQHFRPGNALILMEQGFLASSHSWSEAFSQKRVGQACLGYVFDDIAHYFMADYPNRLIARLNSNVDLTDAELDRARALIERIVERRISKYNSQPLVAPTMTEGYRNRVLVCDQAFGDASTYFGKIDELGFEAMLLAALAENPDAEIIVKTHPDTHWEKGKRIGYYNHLENTGRVRILREPVNPYSLFELVDSVYVGTSQIGLEALFAGKKVVCFGAPFYAGWGLTDDRQQIPHRERRRSLEELFHYFYVWYTIYNVPGKPVPSSIEDVLDYIERHRPVKMPPPVASNDDPLVSIIIPVYDVEAHVEECISSVQRQSLADIEIIVVNDCSPDGSQVIIDRLAAEDPRIKPILLAENIGQGFARNVGLQRAKGRYVFFLDSDDFMASNDHLEKAVNCAEEDDADMVRGRKLTERVEDANGKFIKNRADRTEDFFATPFRGETLASEPRILHGRHFWNWLYRRQFLLENDITFATTQWEERSFLLKSLINAKSISSIDSEAVVYRVRPGSTARREKTEQDFENQLRNFEQVAGLLEQSGAFDPESPLWNTARFQITQYLHFLLLGFAMEVARRSGQAGRDAFFDRVRAALLRTGMTGRDLSREPTQLSASHMQTHAYELIFEALRAGRYEVIETVLALKPVSQADLMALVSVSPADEVHASFQRALSFYARNEMVAASPAPAYVGPKPQIIVHIGSTKTGSTYIQHFLETNRPELLRRGIWYPEVGLFWQKDRPHKQAGHAAFTPAAVRKEPYLKDYMKAGLSLMEGRIHTIILSSEAYFLNEKSVAIADYFSQYPVKMIGYFRRQDDWANSQYCEFVGGGAVNKVDVPIEEWLSLPLTQERLSYRTQIDRWAERLGPENVIVRPYEKKQFVGGDIIADFWSSIGFPECASLDRPPEEMRNDFPLDERHLRLMLQFNKLPYRDRDSYLHFVDAVTKGLARKYPKPARPDMLSAAIRGKLVADHAEENSYIARTYLNRVDGVLFENLTIQERAAGAETDIPLEDVELFYDHYRRYSPSTVAAPPKAGSGSQKPKAKKPAGASNKTAQPANATINFIPIRKSWPLMKRIRVTAKNILLERPTRFERPLLGSTVKSETTTCNGPIRKNWSRSKQARVILKNIYLGRDIYFS